MSVPLELLEAMHESGCTAAQMLAVLRADRDRRFMARLRRRMQQLAGADPQSPVLERAKADSGVRVSAPDGIRMAPIKASAGNGIASSPDLKPAAKVVALRLVQHHNIETGRCDPGIPYLAEKLGLSPRSVRRSIRELEALALLSTDVNAGRGHSNAYRLNLEAMAALAVPIGRKPDSAENRTLVAVKPDGRVRQNERYKQSASVVGGRWRARPPDPRQPQMLFPISSRRTLATAQGAESRVYDDIEREAKRQPSFNVSSLSPADWIDVHAAEAAKAGDGMRVIRDRLATGPPKAASG